MANLAVELESVRLEAGLTGHVTLLDTCPEYSSVRVELSDGRVIVERVNQIMLFAMPKGDGKE